MCDESMEVGEVRFSLCPMADGRIRIKGWTKRQDDTFWAVHMDIGPDNTYCDVSDALKLLLYRLARRVQKD